MVDYIGERLSGRTIVADGAFFEDCDLDGCTLVYSGGDVFAITGKSTGKPILVFDGAAANTLLQLQCLGQMGLGGIVEHFIAQIRQPPAGFPAPGLSKNN